MRWNDFKDINGVKIRIGDKVDVWNHLGGIFTDVPICSLSQLIGIIDNWDQIEVVK